MCFLTPALLVFSVFCLTDFRAHQGRARVRRIPSTSLLNSNTCTAQMHPPKEYNSIKRRTIHLLGVSQISQPLIPPLFFQVKKRKVEYKLYSSQTHLTNLLNCDNRQFGAKRFFGYIARLMLHEMAFVLPQESNKKL